MADGGIGGGGRSDGRRRRAVFMAFGTKGDVFPIAALAAGFVQDQQQYNVVLITHSAHQSLAAHLEANNVTYMPVSSPPVLPAEQHDNISGDCLQSSAEHESFSMRKKIIQMEHRKECLSKVEEVFGTGPNMDGDFIVINFFALEGWHLAELVQVQCIIAAPYLVPYSAPSSFERQFKQNLPLLYKYFQEAPPNTVCKTVWELTEINGSGIFTNKLFWRDIKVSWSDIIHWMWPLFMESWGSWRNECLHLSPVPFTDLITDLPLWYMRAESPLLLYGFSKEIVECPGYWPSGVHVCGFWFLPMAWQFSCDKCRELLSGNAYASFTSILCANHADLGHFLMGASASSSPIFIGLSSIGSMGFLRNPEAFLMVLKAVIESTDYRIILFSSGYQPLDAAIQSIASSVGKATALESSVHHGDSTLLFNGRLFCFSGGSTAAALHAGTPQVVCPFLMDQFYWAERLYWLGVAPEPLKRQDLTPDKSDASSISNASRLLSGAIKLALSPEIKAQAARVAESLSSEDGIGEALKILKEKLSHQYKP